jgi:UDP-3-O-[3-hydroxymyristoyl] glucosamine N-acyltransferase
MVDPRFYPLANKIKLKDVLDLSGAVLAGESSLLDETVSGVSTLDKAHEDELSYVGKPSFISELKKTKASFCFIKGEFLKKCPSHICYLIHPHPEEAFAKITSFFYPSKPQYKGIHPTAVIGENVKLGFDVTIGAHTVIEDNVEIGKGSWIGSGVVIEQGVKVGENCVIQHRAILAYTIIDDEVTIGYGSIIGYAGFGYALNPFEGHTHIPHLGRVLIGKRVQIGANSCVDKGGAQDTIIEDGVVIDNLVQIAHNVKVGKNCVIAAQVGIAGSCEIESSVVLLGQVGVAHRIKIGKDSVIQAQAGIIQDVKPGSVMFGTPALLSKDYFRQFVLQKRLLKDRNIKPHKHSSEKVEC